MRVVFAMLLGLALAGCAYHDQPLGSIKDPPRHLPISAAPPTAPRHPLHYPRSTPAIAPTTATVAAGDVAAAARA